MRYLFFALVFVAGCTVQFQLPPPTVSNLPDGGTVDVLPDTIPAAYAGRPRFYWEQIEQSDSTYSFAITDANNNGQWLDSLRYLPNGPFIDINGDTVATRAYARAQNTDNQVVDTLSYDNTTGVLSASLSGDGQAANTVFLPTIYSSDYVLPSALRTVYLNAGNGFKMVDSTGSGMQVYRDFFGVFLTNSAEDSDIFLDNSLAGTGSTINLIAKGGDTQINLSETQAQMLVDGGSAILATTGNSGVVISTGTNDWVVEDNSTDGQKGVIYAGDYSANFVDRTLPDVAWVRNEISDSLSASGGGGGSMSSFSIAADSGTPETVNDAETVTTTGGFGVNTSIAATNTITIESDSSEIATLYRAQREAGLYVLHAEDFYTSDWAAAINTAIDSLNSIGGGIVYLPPDTLSLTAQGTNPFNSSNKYCIYLKSNVHLRLHNNTLLELADGQQTDIGGPVDIVIFYDAKNVSIQGGAISGNTSGQTGWSGGYGQVTSGTIIYGKSTVTNGIKNVLIKNIRLYDHFSNAIEIGSSSFSTYNSDIRVEDIKCWDIGEGPQVNGAENVIMKNIVVIDSSDVRVGDGVECATCNNFFISNITVNDSLATTVPGSSVDLFGSKNGIVQNVQSYNSTNIINVQKNSAGGACKNIMIDNVKGTALSSTGTQGVVIQNGNTDSIFVSNSVVIGFAQGYSVTGDTSDLATGSYFFNNCEAYLCGNGLFQHSGNIYVNGGDYSNNTINGIVWAGQELASNQSEIGKTFITGARAIGNGDYGLSFSSSGSYDTIYPDAQVSIYAYNNSGGTPSPNVGVNIQNTIGWVDSTSFVKNLYPYHYESGSTANVTGVRDLYITSNGINLINLVGGTNRQIIRLHPMYDLTVTHTGTGANKIRTKGEANLSVGAGDIIEFEYLADSSAWFERGSDINGSETIYGVKTFDDYISIDTIYHQDNLRIVAQDPNTDTVFIEGVFSIEKNQILLPDAPIFYHNGTSAITVLNGNIDIGTGGTRNVRAGAGYGIRSNNPKTTGIDNSTNMGGGTSFGAYVGGIEFLTANSSGDVAIGDISPSYSLDVAGTDGVRIPSGTTAQRPTNAEAVVRYNSDNDELETGDGTNWKGLREQSHGFGTYTSNPGALTPRDGQVYGFDTTTAGWTQTFNTTNMSAGDQITIFFIATDVNSLTIDSSTGGFIRPVANGDFLSDATEAIVTGEGHMDLVFDGTDWWVKE